MTASLGELEQLVLLAILRLGDEAYGVPIRDQIGAAGRPGVTLGAIYKALDRLAAKRLVSSRTGDPSPVRGGRRRRYYRLEAAGEAALERSLSTIRTLTAGLDPRWRRHT